MQMKRGTMVRVRIDHPSFPGKIGVLQFKGGPKENKVVLAEPDNGQVFFFVDETDLVLSPIGLNEWMKARKGL